MNRLLREKICPKCHKMTLDYNDRGFRYRCLVTDCLWEGNEAENESVNSDRLLTPEEYNKAIANAEPEQETVFGLQAQLAKTDNEWLSWLLENLFRETDYGLEWQSTPRIALKRFAERKLEIGL